MTNPIILSVRLMTYNHAEHITRCLEGIETQQTNFNFEVIIGDDFSTDNNISLIKQFITSSTNKNINYILLDRKKGDEYDINRHKKGRLYNFTNIIENCSGKYIALIDGDDYWTDPLKLQKQVDFLEAHPEYAGCFHYTQQTFINHPEKQGRIFGKHGKQLDFTAEDTIATLSPWHTSSFIFRNEAFEKPDWLYNVVSGDMALFSIVAKSGNIICIPEIMSVYQKHEGGITTTKAHNHKNYHKNRIALIQHLDAYHDFKYHKKAQEVITFHTNAINNTNSNKKSIFERVINKLKRLTN